MLGIASKEALLFVSVSKSLPDEGRVSGGGVDQIAFICPITREELAFNDPKDVQMAVDTAATLCD